MKKITGIIALLAGLNIALFSQNEVDALRFSMTNNYGTARSMSMGGSFGALGADFSTLSSNPAGLGLYKRSDFMISPSMSFSKTNATYYGTSREDTDDKFFLSNMGIVFSNEIPQRVKSNGWKNVNFAFGLNKLKNFNNNYIIQGVNDQNSYSDVFAYYAQGINYAVIEDDEFNEFTYDLYPAWWLAIIDTIPGDPDHYISNSTQGPKLQQKAMSTTGGINEVVLSFGANYNDRLYFGATLGFPTIRYKQNSTFTETKLNEDSDPYQYREFIYRETLYTTGTGFNMKFGMIYRPVNFLRIGAAFHSPTWYTSLEDEWIISMESRWDPGSAFQDGFEEPPALISQYNLKTPMKVIGSIGLVLGRYGVISAEYEMVDYGQAKLSNDGSIDYDYITENDNIKAKYDRAQNIKLGTEWQLMNFRIRGGYAILGSPFKNGINDAERKIISAGIGYRGKFFYIDLAWVQQKMSEDYYLYGFDEVSYEQAKTSLDYETDNIIMTLGYRF